MLRIFLVLLLGNMLLTTAAAESVQAITVSFYANRINVRYNTDFVLPFNGQVDEKNLVSYFHQLEKRDYQILLTDLEEQKRKLYLNDWLYYQLLQATLEKIMPNQPAVQRELTCWFLLSKAGYDTRLTFRDGEVYLYVYTKEEVFEVPMIQEEGRTFVNLTSINQEQDIQQALYLLHFAAQPQGKPFSFYLRQLPRLQAQVAQKSFEFNYGDYVYRLDIDTDQTIVEVMKNYPFIAEKQYLEVPLSTSVTTSLIPQLRQMLAGKTQREALEFLVAFTRSSFQYQDDKDYFGRSKPMIADEVFYYPFSDCEDRSALFYRLVQELLDLPMIIIAYKDHLTIGVALAEDCEDAIEYEGRNYCVCDPTGPVNSTVIGRIPRGYEYQPYDIIGKYK